MTAARTPLARPLDQARSDVRRPMFGRVAERRVILEALDAHRSIYVCGPPGVGKTHLVTAACEQGGRPVHRVGDDSDLDLRATAHALGPEGVLLLDGVRGATRRWSEEVHSLVPICRVAVTSRERLAHDGPWLTVQPFEHAGAESEAAQFLRWAVREMAPELELALEPSVQACIDAIARKLGGNPLALLLAAARLPLLSLAEMTEELPERIKLLRTRSDRIEPEQRDFVRCVARTLEPLPCEARAMLTVLSVFGGPVGLEDITRVTNMKDAADALELLDTIAGYSLLHVTRRDGRTEFAVSKPFDSAVRACASARELERAFEQHARYYVDAVAALAPLRSTGASEVVQWMRCNGAELEAIGRRDLVSDELRARALHALGAYRSRAAPSRDAYAACIQGASSASRAGLSDLEAACRLEAADCLVMLADYQRAHDQLAWVEARGDDVARARASCLRSAIHSRRGEYEAAAEAVERGLSLVRGHPEADLVHADLKAARLHTALYRGQAHDLGPDYDEVAQVYRRAGDRLSLARIVQAAAVAALLDGWPEMMIEQFHGTDLVPHDFRRDASTIQLNLGIALLESGRLDDAENVLRSAARLCEDNGYVQLSALVTANAALVPVLRGHTSEAERMLREASTLLAGAEARATEHYLDAVRACVSFSRRDYRRAVELLQRSAELSECATLRARHLAHRGLGLAFTGDIDGARIAVRRARDDPNAFRSRLAAEWLDDIDVAIDAVDGAARVARGDPHGLAPVRRVADWRTEPATNVGRRLVRRWTLDFLSDTPEVHHARGTSVGTLWVSRDAVAARAQDGPVVDLSKRPTLRGLLQVLVAGRTERPGCGVPVESLVRGGWPEERMLPKAAKARVRVAVLTLRREGLRGLLATDGADYLIDPSVDLVIVPQRNHLALLS